MKGIKRTVPVFSCFIFEKRKDQHSIPSCLNKRACARLFLMHRVKNDLAWTFSHSFIEWVISDQA